MVPPVQPLRLRSILHWMNAAGEPSEGQTRRAVEIDGQMVEAFQIRQSALIMSMMRDSTWGTQQGLTRFPWARIALWNEVVQDFLPHWSGARED